MIIEDCGISRSTFYRHFKDKYELMIWYYKDYSNKLIQKYDITQSHEMLKEIALFMKNHDSYFREAYKTDGIHTLSAFITQTVHDFFVSTYKQQFSFKEIGTRELYQITFMTEGCIAALNYYYCNGCKENPDDLAEWIIEMLPDNIKNIQCTTK